MVEGKYRKWSWMEEDQSYRGLMIDRGLENNRVRSGPLDEATGGSQVAPGMLIVPTFSNKRNLRFENNEKLSYNCRQTCNDSK